MTSVSFDEIDNAVKETVSTGFFIAKRLESENPEIIFAAGLSTFIIQILKDYPDLSINDLRLSLKDHALEKVRRLKVN